jgi:DNA-directed RNA polymerase specialized sigma24 family protein
MMEGATVVAYIDLRAVLEQMHPDELTELQERLLYIAESLLRMHGARARHYGYTGEELVNEALLRGFAGDRHCPEGLPLDVFFTWTMKSVLSHEADRAEHELERVSLESDDDSPAFELPAADDVEASATANMNFGRFKDSLDDEELRDYVDLLVREHGSTAEELAVKSGRSVQDIRNLDRKLARRRALWSPR